MAHDLKAPRRCGAQHPGLDNLGIESATSHKCLNCSDSSCRIACLVITEERDKYILVDRSGRPYGNHLPAHSQLAIEDFIVPAFKTNNRIDLGGTLFNNAKSFFLLLSNNHDLSRLDNPCFFFRNFTNCRTQPLFVIDSDGHDDTNTCIDHIRCIPAATHTDFDDGSIDGVISKCCKGHDSKDLKEGQFRPISFGVGTVHHLNVGCNVLPRANEFIGRN